MNKETKTLRTDAQKSAERRYNQKTVIKRVRFNIETESDLLKKIEDMPNFSGWIKEKLREIEK